MNEVRLIDANALLIDEIARCHCVPLVCTTDINGCADNCNSLKNVLDRQPTVEIEQMRHGRWIPYDADSRGYTIRFQCTFCKMYSCTNTYQKQCEFEYCPNCGAMMDGGAENE